MLVIFKLLCNGQLCIGRLNAFAVADDSISKRSAFAIMDEVAHGGIERKASPTDLSQIRAECWIAPPSLANHTLLCEHWRHLADGSTFGGDCQGNPGKMPSNSILKLRLGTGSAQGKESTPDNELFFEPIPANKFRESK